MCASHCVANFPVLLSKGSWVTSKSFQIPYMRPRRAFPPGLSMRIPWGSLGGTPKTLIIVPMDGNRSAPGPNKSPESIARELPENSTPENHNRANNYYYLLPNLVFPNDLIERRRFPTMTRFLPRGARGYPGVTRGSYLARGKIR